MRVSDDVLMAFAESCLPRADRAEMARELLAARRVVADLRARWPEADVLRAYDAGETSTEFQPIDAAGNPDPRKPSFAEALENAMEAFIAEWGRHAGFDACEFSNMLREARRASGE